MKRIYLRAEGTPPDVVIWKDVLREVVRRPLDPQKGADIEELRRGIRILDALDHVGDDCILALEDAEWDHLCAKLKVMPWGVVDRRLIQLVDDVLGATEQPVLDGIIAHAQ